jgi:predicted metalloprotease
MPSLDAEQKPERRRRALVGGVALAAALGLGVAGAKASANLRAVGTPSPEPAHNARSSEKQASAVETAELEAFVASVVQDVDAMWTRDFRRRTTRYVSAEPVLIDTPTRDGCGPGLALGRPDCFGTQRAFIDRSFLHGLDARFGEKAAGAKAYAIAHEMGHHVQRVLGMDKKLEALLAEKPVASHWAEIQIELQADCFAGVWSRRTEQRHLVEPTQIESSIRHTSEFGTERRLERHSDAESPGENFTYAIPRRRIYWFAQGYAHGEIDDCDTFAP